MSYGHVHTDSEGTFEAGIYPRKPRSFESDICERHHEGRMLLNLFLRQTICEFTDKLGVSARTAAVLSTFNSVWLCLVHLSGYPRLMRVYCYPPPSISAAYSVVKQPHSQRV